MVWQTDLNLTLTKKTDFDITITTGPSKILSLTSIGAGAVFQEKTSLKPCKIQIHLHKTK